MSEPYPLPGFAANIYASGDGLALCLTDDGKGHTLQIPATEAGMKLLVQILRERRAARRPYIGQKASPVQYDIEHMLKAMHKFDPKGKPVRPATLDFED